MLAILVGLKGSGKTTVMKKVLEKRSDIKHIVAGDYFAEYYKKKGFSRDEGDLGVDSREHFRIQKEVFKKIREDSESHKHVIVDTHAFLTKKEGYYPGLPLFALQELKPDTIITLDYLSEDILQRRLKDKKELGRERSAELNIDGIKQEQRIQEEFAISAAGAYGCTVKMLRRYEKQEYPFQHADLNAEEIIELFD
jgi:adenylate kinase